ncbi:copper homeostasis protein CutC [Paludicola sp. MB14-C6]|uniref:copper homeostasis protein CutC n=1 Tax=Paludihabitans sp. MB14-C6 TaxID=3070656 RepID=UPI0027DDA6DC|nr:copper homeostasis protein CutC [Paludicola sp. MB14-C6]WMJ23365.1 copper homeostasis protein CutC [Paludicola sp. MB14-C6]
MSNEKLIEICCCSVDDVVEAEKGGADRVELNSAFEAGGLTPTLGSLIEAKKRTTIPIITMIRPRTGGFCYTDFEFDTMITDAKLMLQNGADGIAVGILNEYKNIDLHRTNVLVELCKSYNKEIVFHRAIDITPNLIESAHELVSLGVSRILTSGGKQRCLEGIDTINELMHTVSNQIEILACGSIRPTNLDEIISKTNCNQFHMALMKDLCDNTMKHSHINFNGTPNEQMYKMIDVDQVKAVKNIVNR